MIVSNVVTLVGVLLVVTCIAGLAGLLWAGLLLGAVLVGVGFVLHRNAFAEAGK